LSVRDARVLVEGFESFDFSLAAKVNPGVAASKLSVNTHFPYFRMERSPSKSSLASLRLVSGIVRKGGTRMALCVAGLDFRTPVRGSPRAWSHPSLAGEKTPPARCAGSPQSIHRLETPNCTNYSD